MVKYQWESSINFLYYLFNSFAEYTNNWQFWNENYIDTNVTRISMQMILLLCHSLMLVRSLRNVAWRTSIKPNNYYDF